MMEKLLRRIYNSKKLSLTLKIISHASSLAAAAAFLVMLVEAFLVSRLSALLLLLAAGIPFILVSLARLIINAPRPYELYGFYERPPKNKSGRSFPSRHAFSAFVIGVLAYPFSPVLMIALLLLGVAVSVSRVLLGMHFPRDVFAGCAIGVLSGVIGLLIMM